MTIRQEESTQGDKYGDVKKVNERQYCDHSGKVCYSRKDAGEVVNKCKRYVSRKKKRPLRVYYCRYCGCYHTTHYRTFSKWRKE